MDESSSGGDISVGSKTHVVLAPKWLGKRVGRFKLLALLGQGAMGRVFRAEDTLMQRHVALKMLPRTLKRGQNNVGAEMLIREARAAAAIEHPNAVQIYEINEAGDVYYIAMELLEGGSLRDLVKAAGPLDPTRACRLAAEAAEALAYAHQMGVVHRDVKPANLMLNRAGRCKVVDFGLARVDDPTDLTNFLAESVGTPQFIAPEILTGTPASAQSDVYSLAGTVWYLLTGHPPFEAGTAQDLLQKHVSCPLPDLRAIRPDVPQGLADTLAVALSKRPNERYPTMDQFAKVLRVHTIPLAASAADLEAMLPPSASSSGAGFAPPPAAELTPPRQPPQRPASPASRRPARPQAPPDRSARSKTNKRAKPWWLGWQAAAAAAMAMVLLLIATLMITLHSSAAPRTATNTPAVTTPPPPTVAPTVVAIPPPETPAPAPTIVAVPTLPLGDFAEQSDIGPVNHPGYVEFSAADHRYNVSGSGEQIWAKLDGFHFVWRKVSGDVKIKATIAFVGSSIDPHRKACLMIRQDLNPDAPYVDAALYGDGSGGLQYRLKAGEKTSQFELPNKDLRDFKLERHGDSFVLYAAPHGKKLTRVAAVKVPLHNPVYVGLAVNSHNVNLLETATFSDVAVTVSHKH